jgi:hypothetical protein
MNFRYVVFTTHLPEKLKSVDFIKSIFQETQTFVITPIFGKSKFLKFWIMIVLLF